MNTFISIFKIINQSDEREYLKCQKIGLFNDDVMAFCFSSENIGMGVGKTERM